MEQKKRIKEHFERMSDTFDAIYEEEKHSLFHRLLDILFRSHILKKRMEMMIALCGDVKGKDILDIGCGPGRFAVELAKGKPNLILGIDISDKMISLAKEIVKNRNYQQLCVFQKTDFMDKDFTQKFDIVLASGVFDYVPEPEAFLAKVSEVAREMVILSFPIKFTLLTPLRKMWLAFRDCPNFYYTKNQIKRLLNGAGLKAVAIYRIGSFLVNGNYILACTRR